MPEADVLIHCGDWSGSGTEKETRALFLWLGDIAHKYKRILLTPGNHDWFIQRQFPLAKEILSELVPNAELLLDDGLSIDGVTFWGHPWTPIFGHWAFMGDMEELSHKCQAIPDNIDVLISHGPPLGTLDHVERFRNSEWDLESIGCYELKTAVERIRPKISCFGHLHFDGGKEEQKGSTLFVNAAVVNENYELINKPRIYEI